MEKYIKLFFMVSGVVIWVLIILVMIINIIEENRDKKKRRKEHMLYCDICEEETPHIITGDGFNQHEHCTVNHI